MEERMDEDAILSMMRALLEAQEKGLANAHGVEPMEGNYAQGNQSGFGKGYNAWEPTVEHTYDRSYTYQEDLYAQAYRSEYGAGYDTWEPPSNHGLDGSSAYLGDLYDQAYRSEYGAGYDTWEPTATPEPSSDYQDGIYAPEHQSGYEQGYKSWDMQYANGETNCSSPPSYSEETYSMMKTLLEAQTTSLELINSFDFGRPSIPPCQNAAATEPVESFTTNLTPWIEERNSDCISLHETSPQEVPPVDMGDDFEETAPHKNEFQQEAEWTTIESEFLLGFDGDEQLGLSYEDSDAHEVTLSNSPMENVVCEAACPVGLVVECTKAACESSIVIHALPPMEVIHMPPVYKLEPNERRTEVASPPAQDTGIPLRHLFPNAPTQPIGSLPNTEAPTGHPWTLPYEEIRMKEFGGWFYDEYDPGDPPVCRVHLDKSQA